MPHIADSMYVGIYIGHLHTHSDAHACLLMNLPLRSCCSTDHSDESLMVEWNRNALVSLREKLKLNVLMKTSLNDKLQKPAGGFMSQAEAQAVQSKPSNAEQMGELIEVLLGKRNADFKIFCSMLRQSNYSMWADELEKKAKKLRGEAGIDMIMHCMLHMPLDSCRDVCLCV